MAAIFPVSTKQQGMCLAPVDVCLTPAPPAPPVPIPYPNLAQVPTATGESQKVKIMNMGVIVEQAKLPQSQGDEAGVNGGVMSGMNRGEVQWKLFSAKVKVEGKGVAYVTSITAHNGVSANAPGGLQVVPSQAKVLTSP